MKVKNYWAPIPTFLVFLTYIAMGIFVLIISKSSGQDVNTYLKYSLPVTILIVLYFSVRQLIRLAYHLQIKEGKIYECGLFTLKRVIPIESIKRIRWEKQNFWTGGTGIVTTPYQFTWNSEWRRQFYIESPEHTLPKYPVSKRLIKDLIKTRPELVVDTTSVVFTPPFA